MKRNRIQNRCIATCLMFIAMLMTSVGVNAQNVTVKPSTGAMIAAVPENISGTSGDYDTFYRRGGFATWRHNQLCLTMTASDAPGLTANGQLANPANNIYGRTSTNEIELGRGATSNTRNSYMNLALPKGYRFTGYEIVFSRNRSDFGNNDNGGNNTSNNPNTGGTTRFGETDANFNYLNGYYQDITYNANATLEEGSVTISKEQAEGMSNVLYFKLTDANTGTGRMVVTFHSITLYFTAEDDYTPVLPQSQITTPVSAIDIPFETGKVDYGSIERRNYNGQWRVSYSSANVIDMKANMTLYEAGSIEDGTHFDGTTGKVVKYEEGINHTIRNYQDFFILGKNGAEQVYYLETPTYVVLPDEAHTKNPVGFRIVGAELEYEYGTSIPESHVTESHNYITYTSNGTTYFLDKTGHFVTDTQTEWHLDGNNYVYCDNVYLTYSGSNNNYSLAVGNSSSEYKLRMYTYNDKSILLLSDGYYYYRLALTGNTTGSTPALGDNLDSNDLAVYSVVTTTTTIPAITPAPFKLHIYGKDGVELEDSPIEINSSEDNNKITLTGFNNDAIKFGVEGVGFVKGTLTMQALDPYIDKMSVVCQDQTQSAIRMTQTFTANDFSVSGGEFYFYLPSDCVGHQVKVTYEDLWSHYADETYEGQTETGHNSRFSFVNSAHYNKFTNDNIYSDINEAAAGKSAVSERQKVDKVGKTKFKFNNADQLSTQAGTLTEYPFTQANYAAAPNNGSFYTMLYDVKTTDQKQTAYVFTTDETRYNIAPTTAVQHRTYAFYEMIVHVQSATYTPKVEIKKVYSSTCVEQNGAAVNKPYYGAVVTAPFGTPVQAGFASDKEVEEAIDAVITARKDSYDNTDVPESAKQILYVDMSGLAGYYTNSQAAMSLSSYKNTKLAANALIFMPKGVTTNDGNNFAYMTEGNNFRAAANIVLTDKQPFFSPYDIQVPSQNYATYKRLRTASSEKLVKKATIVMPFTMDVDADGVHENETEDGFKFYLRELKKLDLQEGTDQYGTGNFVAISPADGKAPANKPYMVEVISNNGDDYSFIASQKGSNIMKTEGETFKGEEVSFSGGKVTNYGTYSGVSIPRATKVFYFNRDKYVSSESLASQFTHVYVQPFRAYYTTTGQQANAKMAGFIISYDLFSDNGGITTSLTDISKPKVMTINTGNSSMVITASEDIQVKIMGANGVSVDSFNMNAGEQRQVNVPSGIYIVNNTKILVK